MATVCKNCGTPLIFDPETQKMRCGSCGSLFRAEEVETYGKERLAERQTVPMERSYGTEETIDCSIYTCGHCGAEIIIHGTEASSRCVYCGSSAVVFSRIAKERKPDAIIPFSISQEDAVETVRDALSKQLLIPKEIREFSAENVRGIYLPYWIVDAEFTDAAVVNGKRQKADCYYGVCGKLELYNLPVCACTALSEQHITKLEPYDMSKLIPFDEDYLLGFCSNISDLSFGGLRDRVRQRGRYYFNKQAINACPGDADKEVIADKSCLVTDYGRMKYAFLPAWFVSFDYNGKHHTVLVNGQTGKVICGLPWRRKLFVTHVALFGLPFTALFTAVFYAFFRILMNSSGHTGGGGRGLGVLVGLGVMWLMSGISNYRKTVQSIERTQSEEIYHFAKERQ